MLRHTAPPLWIRHSHIACCVSLRGDIYKWVTCGQHRPVYELEAKQEQQVRNNDVNFIGTGHHHLCLLTWPHFFVLIIHTQINARVSDSVICKFFMLLCLSAVVRAEVTYFVTNKLARWKWSSKQPTNPLAALAKIEIGCPDGLKRYRSCFSYAFVLFITDVYYRIFSSIFVREVWMESSQVCICVWACYKEVMSLWAMNNTSKWDREGGRERERVCVCVYFSQQQGKW